jgi:pimeloyl-ACP methyl ester carboxylesterase
MSTAIPSSEVPVRSVPVGDADLAVVERGSGEPVIFVHGGISDWRTWRPQLEGLSGRWRTIAYSRRYHWPNEPIPEGADYVMTPHVRDLATLIRSLGAAPAHLVGNSWGAFVCLMLARREPELVRSLVLEEPPVIPLFVSTPPRPTELLRVLLTRPRTALGILDFGARIAGPATEAFRRGDDREALRRFVYGVLGREAYEALPEERKEQMSQNLRPLRAVFLGSGFEPFSDADVRAVRAPTLLLTGERSPAFMRRLTDRVEELLPDVRRVEIRGASHAMHEEQPAAVNRAIAEFLG